MKYSFNQFYPSVTEESETPATQDKFFLLRSWYLELVKYLIRYILFAKLLSFSCVRSFPPVFSQRSFPSGLFLRRCFLHQYFPLDLFPPGNVHFGFNPHRFFQPRCFPPVQFSAQRFSFLISKKIKKK